MLSLTSNKATSPKGKQVGLSYLAKVEPTVLRESWIVGSPKSE
jgi:hypothetical protein